MSEKIKIHFIVRIMSLILLVIDAAILYSLFTKIGYPSVFSIKDYFVLFIVAISIRPLAYVVIQGQSSNVWFPKWKDFLSS